MAASKADVDLRKNIVEQRSVDGHKKINNMVHNDLSILPTWWQN